MKMWKVHLLPRAADVAKNVESSLAAGEEFLCTAGRSSSGPGPLVWEIFFLLSFHLFGK